MLVVISLVVLLGMAAFVIDIGYAYYVQRSLQSSADAAALAGAQELPNAANAESVARQYSGRAGGQEQAQQPKRGDNDRRRRSVAPVRPALPSTRSR